jgi:nickel transport protein
MHEIVSTSVLRSALVAILGVATAFSACAHGIWFAERSSQTAIIYGHGAEDSDPIRRLDKFKTITAQDGKGNALPAAWKRTDHLLLADVAKEAAVLTATLDNGFWSKSPEGKWIAKGKDEVPGATDSGRYVKFTTQIRGDLTLPLKSIEGHRLQIVPLAAKLPQHLNEAMTVRVLFDGKPVAGAKFIRDYLGDPDAKPMITGKDGLVKFRVRNHGLNVLAVAYDAPTEDPAKASKTGMHATLSFAVQHAPE